MRTQEEIQAMIDRAANLTNGDKTNMPAMTFEEGVEHALQWAIGDTNDEPIEE